MNCPECSTDNLQKVTEETEISSRVHPVVVVDFDYFRCAGCDFEFVPPEMDKANSLRIFDARREAKGKPTSSHIRAVRETFGLSARQASLLFCDSENAINKYERGEIHPSGAMDCLLYLAEEMPETVAALADWKSIGINYQPWRHTKVTVTSLAGSSYAATANIIGYDRNLLDIGEGSQFSPAQTFVLDKININVHSNVSKKRISDAA